MCLAAILWFGTPPVRPTAIFRSNATEQLATGSLGDNPATVKADTSLDRKFEHHGVPCGRECNVWKGCHACRLPILVLCAVHCHSQPSSVETPRHGQLSGAEYRLTYLPRFPLRDYHPQPGDVIFSTTDNRLATARYALALTCRPTHVGIVVRMPGGELGVLEAGGGDSHLTRTTTVPERFARATDKAIWVRRPLTPLTAEQSAALSEFANAVEGRPYASRRQTAQGTIFRCAARCGR